MAIDNLFDYTVKQLDKHFATRNIVQKINNPDYNKEFGEKICNILFKICQNNEGRYDNAVNDFINFSLDFLKLQMELEKTGSYKFKTFQEAKGEVYDDHRLMSTKYLNGMLLSQAFWINHYKIFDFFINEFCQNNAANGKVIEVPLGTGIFLSEFMEHNGGWAATGCDISKSAIDFAKKVIGLNNPKQINLFEKDFFEVDGETKYDKIICGELLEHVDNPQDLLSKLNSLLCRNGKIFLTTAIWAAAIDHIYVFKSVEEVREMIKPFFNIEQELALNVFQNKKPEDKKTPINYACILTKREGT